MSDLGIYHYGARFYSSKLGRFISSDTIVPNLFNPQDFNRFSYVRNNPIKYIDPTGHMADHGGGWSGGGGCLNCNPPTCTTCDDDGGGGTDNPSQTQTPTPTTTPTSTPCPQVAQACLSTQPSDSLPTIDVGSLATIPPTFVPTNTPTPNYGPYYTLDPTPPTPHFAGFDIDWNKVDKWEAALDVAGIIGDIVSVLVPGPGEAVQAGITFIEVVAAGDAVLDLVLDGNPGDLYQEIIVATLEQDIRALARTTRLLARTTRWVPLAGSVASGYNLYANAHDAITIRTEDR